MEFHLLDTANNIDFQFPVNPASYSIKTGNNNTSFVVEDIGEINLLGRPKLGAIDLAGFFPKQAYYFMSTTDFPAPYDCVKTIENWRANNTTPRFIITGTDINMLVSIEGFEHGEEDGTGDVQFKISLKEYKVVSN